MSLVTQVLPLDEPFNVNFVAGDIPRAYQYAGQGIVIKLGGTNALGRGEGPLPCFCGIAPRPGLPTSMLTHTACMVICALQGASGFTQLVLVSVQSSEVSLPPLKFFRSTPFHFPITVYH